MSARQSPPRLEGSLASKLVQLGIPRAARGRRLPPNVALYVLASITISFLAASSAPTPLYAVYQAEWGFSPITTTVVFGVYAVAVLVGALSFLPGGLGSTEAVMTALLVTQGFTVGDALLVTILCRIVTLWLAVCIGWVAVFALRHRTAPVVATWP